MVNINILNLIVVALCFISIICIIIRDFINLPSKQQLAKAKEWLLFAVIEAEKEFGGGTGAVKLRYVYDKFLSKFPSLAKAISFEKFSILVNDALVTMKKMLQDNKAVKLLVEEGA
jgi:hypothetical protein